MINLDTFKRMISLAQVCKAMSTDTKAQLCDLLCEFLDAETDAEYAEVGRAIKDILLE